VRQAFTQKHAENQLQDLWRPVGVMLLVIIFLTSCVPSQSEQLPKAAAEISPQTPQVSEVATQADLPTSTPTLVVEVTNTPTIEPTVPPTVQPRIATPIPETAQAVSAASTGGVQVQGKVTGYYCRQVSGFPIWDGGGYCGNMSSGQAVYVGAAACGAKWQLGQKLEISGFGIVVCEDRGHLEFTQVDVFFETNESLYKSGISNRYMAISEVP